MRIFAIVALALLLGCRGDSTSPEPVPSVVGTWDLRTINGEPLPAAANGTGVGVVSFSQLTFENDRRLVFEGTLYTDIRVMSSDCSCGPFTQSGDQVMMGDYQSATVSGKLLTRRPFLGSTVWVYTRE